MTEPLAKILVVDDILANRKLAGKILAGEFEVDAVKSGEEALDFFTRKLPDLVLLDIYMEGMDGFEVLMMIMRWKPGASRRERWISSPSPLSRPSCSSGCAGWWSYSGCAISCSRR